MHFSQKGTNIMFWDNFISLCNSRDVSPTAACSALGFSSTMVTKWKNGSKPRDATLLKVANYFGVSVDYLLGAEEEPLRIDAGEVRTLDQSNVRMVPLFHSVSAGFGAYASSEVVDYMPAYFTNPAESVNTICIKVCGDSMYPKIEDGDIIQVHKQESVDSGSIAVVLIDGDDGLVKRVTYGDGWIELQSINPMYQTMRYDGADVLRVRVVGLVTQVTKGINGRKVPAISVKNSKSDLMNTIDRMSSSELREFNKVLNEYLKAKEK